MAAYTDWSRIEPPANLINKPLAFSGVCCGDPGVRNYAGSHVQRIGKSRIGLNKLIKFVVLHGLRKA